jgi:hypothetical protein
VPNEESGEEPVIATATRRDRDRRRPHRLRRTRMADYKGRGASTWAEVLRFLQAPEARDRAPYGAASGGCERRVPARRCPQRPGVEGLGRRRPGCGPSSAARTRHSPRCSAPLRPRARPSAFSPARDDPHDLRARLHGGMRIGEKVQPPDGGARGRSRRGGDRRGDILRSGGEDVTPRLAVTPCGDSTAPDHAPIRPPLAR